MFDNLIDLALQLPSWAALAVAAWAGVSTLGVNAFLAYKGARRYGKAFLAWKARPSSAQRVGALESRFDDLYHLIEQRAK